MGLDIEYIDGQTPIDEDEKLDLKIDTITTRGELDEWEQMNIEGAIKWSMGLKLSPEEIICEEFICELHKRMYNKVWKWAGSFRKSNKNIGVDKFQISIELRMLCGDFIYWHTNKIYPPDEMALRFKHRLVAIHCFPNGNGRHSRLMADIIIDKVYGLDYFSWGGQSNLSVNSDVRKEYLRSLRQADRGDYQSLLEFARA